MAEIRLSGQQAVILLAQHFDRIAEELDPRKGKHPVDRPAEPPVG